MALRRMYDAAYPPAHPPNWEVCGFYLGGDTPHVWTQAELDAQPARFRLGIWVRDHGGDPSADADAAAAAYAALGAPLGCAVVLDLEERVDGAFVSTFDAHLHMRHLTTKYGSVSTIWKNPWTSGGTWTADWDERVALDVGAAATQFASAAQLGTAYDASVISDSVPLWDTQLDWSAAIMGRLATLKQGDNDMLQVGVLQSLLDGTWHRDTDPVLTVNHTFDAPTTALLKVVQGRHGLTADGICGPKTWALLLGA
jgi:peptidoglycan hydrolase-like protein with peptidoglycan-binding domain